jgi:hypothetical protein
MIITVAAATGQNSAYRHRKYEGALSETKAPFAFLGASGWRMRRVLAKTSRVRELFSFAAVKGTLLRRGRRNQHARRVRYPIRPR